MNKRVLIATIAGGIVSFLLGWAIMGGLLESYYAENCPGFKSMMKTEEEFMKSGIIFVFLSSLVMAYLYAVIFDRWASISTFVGGLLGGFLISFCISLAMDLQFYGLTTMYSNATVVLVDVIAGSVMGALVGGVIGAVLGMFSKKAD